MNKYFESLKEIRKAEFWAASTIFVFAIFLLLNNSPSNAAEFKEAGIHLSFYENYFFPLFFQYIIFYCGFLILNFKILPDLISKKNIKLNVILLVGTFLISWICLSTLSTYSYLYFLEGRTVQEFHNFIFEIKLAYTIGLFLMFGVYTLLKIAVFYFLSKQVSQKPRKKALRTGVVLFFFWFVSFLLLLVSNIPEEFLFFYALIGFCGIIIYCYSFYFLQPKSIHKKNPLLFILSRAFFWLLVLTLPILIIFLASFGDEDAAFSMVMLNFIFQFFIIVPVSRVLFKRHMKGNKDLFILKKELGRSTANFDFLRSQINPHFLFNALNTIYGTAIQEKAERTSEGIEKLGEMMRFMLEENMQEKILLNNEIHYLNNYISLQFLRVEQNPNIKITSHIEDMETNYQISPMLLIPFVENAFKHGISFREPSYINIALEIKENTLYFDVHNSKHPKLGNDPEKNKGGIGLANVKNRLALLYSKKHNLMIRETAKDFFVHLTIQLN